MGQAHKAVQHVLIRDHLGADVGRLAVLDDGDAGNSPGGVHAHHHGDGALGAVGRGLHRPADGLSAADRAVEGCHMLGQFPLQGDVLVRLEHLRHGGGVLRRLSLVDDGLGDVVDDPQQQRHRRADGQKRAGDAPDVGRVQGDLGSRGLGGLGLLLGGLGLGALVVILAHLPSASFLGAFCALGTPKRWGWMFLSMIHTVRFIIKMA